MSLDHPEWRGPDLECAWRDKATKLISRVCGSVLASLSLTRALVLLCTPFETAATLSLLNEGAVHDVSAPAGRAGAVPIGRTRYGGSFSNAPVAQPEGAVRNASHISWMTAVECTWYRERGLQITENGWALHVEGERAFSYRLELCLLDID